MGGRGRVKRQQIEADDGWTVITHGLSNLSVGSKKGGGKRKNAVQGSSMPTAIVDGLTAEKLLQDFNNRTGKWEATACAQHLKGVLAKREWDVREAVCIGIGSFSRDWEHRHRAMWQLVLFMSVVLHLRKTNSEVKLYAQEPAFTPLDHAFLSLLSIDICTDAIEAQINDRSFVFSPFVDWYILLPVFLKGKNPVLYVGNEILDGYEAFAQSEEKRKKLEECDDLGRKWLAKRDLAKLSEFDMHPHALNGMVVYWVQSNEGDQTEADDHVKLAVAEEEVAEVKSGDCEAEAKMGLQRRRTAGETESKTNDSETDE